MEIIKKRELPIGLKPVLVPSHSRKQIQCPKCGSRIIDAATEIHTEIRALSEKVKQISDYYMKCERCGVEIGIRKLR